MPALKVNIARRDIKPRIDERVRRIFSALSSGMVGYYLLFCSNFCYAFMFSKSPDPGSVEINFNKVGVAANFDLLVKKDSVYWFSVRFYFPKNDQSKRSIIRNILGGNAVDKFGNALEPGISTPMSLKIYSLCEGVGGEVYSKDVDPLLSSWGGDYFEKNIGRHFLASGLYNIQLINNRPAQEFFGIPVTFEVGMSAKTETSSANEIKEDQPCQHQRKQ